MVQEGVPGIYGDHLKKKRQTGKKTDAFFFQPASWTLHMQGKETIYRERDNNLYFTVKL